MCHNSYRWWLAFDPAKHPCLDFLADSPHTLETRCTECGTTFPDALNSARQEAVQLRQRVTGLEADRQEAIDEAARMRRERNDWRFRALDAEGTIANALA